MLVSAIENGTVIDHIPAEKTYEVVDLLGLRELDTPITIGYNLPSKKIGRKGIIKVTDKFFSNEEISRLSVVAPKIVLNIIKEELLEDKQNCTNFSSLHNRRFRSNSPRLQKDCILYRIADQG